MKVRVRSHDAPLAARELKRFIVLNGHNATLKNVEALLVRRKRSKNIEQTTGNLSPKA